jgi:hypothetical protein
MIGGVGIEMHGLSTDEKPVNKSIPNGSVFVEMDTSDVYMFDEENEQWRKLGD